MIHSMALQFDTERFRNSVQRREQSGRDEPESRPRSTRRWEDIPVHKTYTESLKLGSHGHRHRRPSGTHYQPYCRSRSTASGAGGGDRDLYLYRCTPTSSTSSSSAIKCRRKIVVLRCPYRCLAVGPMHTRIAVLDLPPDAAAYATCRCLLVRFASAEG